METHTHEHHTHDKPAQSLPLPIALVLAALIIAGGLYLGLAHKSEPAKPQTLSEQVGVSASTLSACLAKGDMKAVVAAERALGEKAMSHLDENERGTPYSIVVSKEGYSAEIRGAYPYDNSKQIIESVITGKSGKTVNIDDTDTINSTDHVYGNKNAAIVVFEYADLECPYCHAFHPTMKRIVDESNGTIAWVYRSYPLSFHAHAEVKAEAAECIAQAGGNDAFWKYTDVVFKLLDPKGDDFDPGTL